MKKGIALILFLACVISLAGCNSNTSLIEDNTSLLEGNTTLIEGNSDPKPMSDEEQFHDFLDVEVDSSYDNTIIKIEKDSYSVDSEKIFCTVQNNNVGKAFYFYEIPFIEKKIDDDWVRLSYNADRLDIAQWTLCAVEGNTTKPNSSRLTVILDDINPKVTPGEYRLVIFTAKKTLYAPFTLVK